MQIRDLIDRFGGLCLGDSTLEVTDINAAADAQPGEVTFAINPAYLAAAEAGGASAVVVPVGTTQSTKTLICARDVQAYVADLLELFRPQERPAPGVHPRAVVADSAVFGARVSVGPNAVIEGDCRIGDDCIIGPGVWLGRGSSLGAETHLHANVSVYAGTRIGRRVVVHSGAVIGADGFRFVPTGGPPKKVPQVGSVRIDDDVEIGANTCIDRATFGVTHLRTGVKIDNLVQIGHNCVIGANSMVAAQSGMAGSVTIGARALLAGQTGIAEHLTIGDEARLCAQSGVISNVPAKEVWFGYPARPHRQFLTELVIIRRLIKMYDRLAALVSDRSSEHGSSNGWDTAPADSFPSSPRAGL